MLPLPITTPRLRLRRLRTEDLVAFQAVRHDPELGRWQGWTPEPDDTALQFLHEMATTPWPAPGQWLQIGIASLIDDALIGDIGLSPRTGGGVEVGITLAQAHQHRGLAREAIAALLEALADAGLAHTAIGALDERNTASAAMLAALGFVRVAVEPVLWRGEPVVEWHFERRLRGDAAAHARLHGRLAALADSLMQEPDALALLGLGSVGRQHERLDAWSDLDFFVLVRSAEAKARFVESLAWLERAHPLAWSLRNTVDGHKALMRDGVLCEFAVFTPEELPHIPYAPGRWVWRRAEVPAVWAEPTRHPAPPTSTEWRVGEALSNLLVGLLRHHRGEHLAALRMVQVHALDRVLELIDERTAPAAPTPLRDPFAVERRVEQRLAVQAPELLAELAVWSGGVAGTPAAALSLLSWLERHHPVAPAMAARIRALASERPQRRASPSRPPRGFKQSGGATFA
jgi:RimJ/RimL family protein N-acetyltransferase